MKAALTVVVTHSDVHRETYQLIAHDAGGGVISVREANKTILPSYCPERHINTDGSFCLSWSEDIDLAVIDEGSAVRWWEQLMQFLRKQRRAWKKKQWPDSAWAHGIGAARCQRVAEQAAARLGSRFQSALHKKQLKIVATPYRSPTQGAVMNMLCGGQVAYSVWARTLKTINKQQACVCSRGDIRRHRRLRNCESHADDVDELAASLLCWEKAEKAFWEHARTTGHTCCGTIDGCPLRPSTEAKRD